MSADPKQVLRILDYRGIDIRLEDDRLIARSRHGQVPPDMISFIRYFRDQLLTELRTVQPGKPTTESEVA